MLYKSLSIFFLSLLLSIFSCQNKEYDKYYEMNNTRLIDGILLDNNSIFKKDDIDLKKYKFKGFYIEDLYIRDLLDKKYHDDFIKYLTENEDNKFASSLITQLLIIRIYQLRDEKAFEILLSLSKNEDVSYNGIELYDMILTRILIENPQFFIEQCYKNNNADFLKYIVSLFNQYFVNNDFFQLNTGYLESNGGELLLNPEVESTFSHNFKNTIDKLPKVEAVFSPSLYTGWKNKTIVFTDISSLFGKSLTDKLSVGGGIFYKLYIIPELDKYIIKASKSEQKTHIQDPDGFTNLRKEKNAQSEILQKIKSGEHIDVLDNSGDWFLIKTKEGKEGYVHKSRIKEN